VEPRLDRGDRLVEDPRGFFIRQLLDVPQDEHGTVGFGQLIDGVGEDGARLSVEKLSLWRLRPIGQQVRTITLPVAIFLKGREVLLEADFKLGPLAPPLEEGGVGCHAVDPGAQGRSALEAVDFAREGKEDILHHFFGIGIGAGDAAGDPVDARGVALH